MGNFEQSIPVYVAPQRLFEYLANVDHLSEYMPRITEAHRADGGEKVDVTAEVDQGDGEERTVEGEAWMRVSEPGRRLAWGSPGPHDYQGELEVQETASHESKLVVRLHTERGDAEAVDAGLIETVERIKDLAENYAVTNP